MRVVRSRLSKLLAIGALCAAASALAGCANANTYWYCWDQGAKDPHHIGHAVDGDHVCSNAELKGTGFSPRRAELPRGENE